MADVKAVYIQVPRELWERMDEARWELKTRTDRDTYIRLWELGLESLKNQGKKKR